MPELMDKVIDNLWIGSLAAALDAELLHKNGIKSILTAMRGRIAIQKVRIMHRKGEHRN
jgi:dual specificity phosphatase 12